MAMPVDWHRTEEIAEGDRPTRAGKERNFLQGYHIIPKKACDVGDYVIWNASFVRVIGHGELGDALDLCLRHISWYPLSTNLFKRMHSVQ